MAVSNALSDIAKKILANNLKALSSFLVILARSFLAKPCMKIVFLFLSKQIIVRTPPLFPMLPTPTLFLNKCPPNPHHKDH